MQNEKNVFWETKGFYVAGIYNLIGILGFTLFFTNPTMEEADPIVFSWLGQIAIILWGLAYLSVSKNFWNVPFLITTFSVEKMLYAYAWGKWLEDNQETLSTLWEEQPVYGLFFSTYGAGDFLFGLFFAYVAIKAFQGKYY